MAIKNTTNGRYIKVIRESAVFTPSGVEVGFLVFESKEERDRFFQREKEISEFVSKLLSLQRELCVKLDEFSKSYVEGTDDFEARVLSDKIKRIFDTVQIISPNWDIPSVLEAEYKKDDFLKEMGFSESWLEPLGKVEHNRVRTGKYTNQTFTYECLYSELKKVFKNDYIDC